MPEAKINPAIPPAVTPAISGEALTSYLLEHIDLKTIEPDQVQGATVTKPLHVFKAAWSRRSPGAPRRKTIVNLIIPVGATIKFNGRFAEPIARHYYGEIINRDIYKFRANRAFVHSIADMETGERVEYAYSDYDPQFFYRVGKTVRPTDLKRNLKRFRSNEVCTTGIHFLLNVEHAAHYLY